MSKRGEKSLTVNENHGKPKALMVSVSSNPVGASDSLAFGDGLESIGFEVEQVLLKDLDKVADSYDFSSYDFIGMFPSFNAMFVSGGTRRTTVQRMIQESNPGAFHLIVCDVALAFDPYMWNKGDVASKDKVNVFMERPITVLGSFSNSFYDDADAMKLKDRKWMNKVHPDSEFITLEWLFFHKDRATRKIQKLSSETGEYTGSPIDRFYYGIERPRIAKSLRGMGMGESPYDAIFGKIGKKLPEIRNLMEKPKNRLDKAESPSIWVPMAKSANTLLLPYEKIKGEHQATLRLLEYAFLANNVESDPQINSEILRYLQRDAWDEKFESVSRELESHVDSYLS